MTTTTITTVATMTTIDPLLAPAQQLEDSPTRRRGRRARPAHSTKILVAGASATALLGMVAAMGWQSRTTAASGAGMAPTVTDSVLTPVAISPVVSAATPTVPPVVAMPANPPANVPATAAPVVTQAPIVIPVAVPAPAQSTGSTRAAHTTTKSSG
jgi:hypothetical protein